MRSAAMVVNRMLRRNGVVDGQPRIYNHTSGAYVLGYTEINTMATTPFSRTKTHKAWFAGDSVVSNGDLIEDRVDGLYYLVMSLKSEYSGGRVAYTDGTLYYANSQITIHRFGTGGKSPFGRDASGAAEEIASGVRAMVTPVTLDVIEQEDQIHDRNKIKMAVQASVDVAERDRVTTQLGEVYKVVSIDRTSLQGIKLLIVETDIR